MTRLIFAWIKLLAYIAIFVVAMFIGLVHRDWIPGIYFLLLAWLVGKS